MARGERQASNCCLQLFWPRCSNQIWQDVKDRQTSSCWLQLFWPRCSNQIWQEVKGKPAVVACSGFGQEVVTKYGKMWKTGMPAVIARGALCLAEVTAKMCVLIWSVAKFVIVTVYPDSDASSVVQRARDVLCEANTNTSVPSFCT